MAADDPAQTSTELVGGSQPAQRDERARGLGIALAVAVAALLILWWLYSQTTIVPDVVGSPQDEARETLVASELAVGTLSEVRTSQQPPGYVADQAPVEGARVLKGTSIDLALALASGIGDEDGMRSEEQSIGFAPSTDVDKAAPSRNQAGGGGISSPGGPWVPNVQALTESAARSRLRAAGYRASVRFGPVTTGPGKGTVYYQDPEPDARAARGTTVEIWISTGGPGSGNALYERPYAQPGE